jgi:hypothetical protein
MTTQDAKPDVYQSRALLAGVYGVPFYRFGHTLDSGGQLFRWVPNDQSTADGRTVIAGTSGYEGRWLLCRNDDKGADIADASPTITVGQGAWRRVVGPLSVNRTITLSTTNAAAGDVLELTRTDTNAYTVAVVNGGIGGGTLYTMPVSSAANVRACFDGTNWLLRSVSTW